MCSEKPLLVPLVCNCLWEPILVPVSACEDTVSGELA